MKNQLGVIVLVVICLGLVIALVAIKKQAMEEHRTDTGTIVTLSNDLRETSSKLDEQRQVTVMLEKDLDTQRKSYGELSNNLTQVSGTLTKTEATLKATEEEVRKRDSRIADLETQNQMLDKQAADLSLEITNLTTKITETQRRLAASEGDRALLEKELKHLLAEKTELERQFNDLTILRAQVSKLKEEMVVARRTEWMRQGLYATSEQKGAQKLMQGVAAPQTKAAPKPSYDLNVEVSADGSVKVIPPTNAPTSSKPPAGK